MQTILPGLFHWTAFHEDIGQDVHSYCLVKPEFSLLIDPKRPSGGLAWFKKHPPPKHIYLTNRLHYRDSAAFVEAFDSQVWCHRAGLHEFTPAERVKAFDHGDVLPGDVRALRVGALCPEETALLLPPAVGAVALGDAVIRDDDELSFVSDELMDDPPATKRRLLRSLRALLKEPFDHLLLAHGKPWIGGGKAALRQFVDEAKKGTTDEPG